MARIVKIKSSEIPGPYNLLDLAEGQSITFIAVKYEKGKAVREIVSDRGVEHVEGPIMRVYVDLTTPVFGSPYLDILAGRTIAMLESLFKVAGLPLKITLTASGKEPSKWYEVSWSPPEKPEKTFFPV